MRVNEFESALTLAIAAAIGGTAQTPADTIDGQVTAARAAAGKRHVELFSQLCAPANTLLRAAGRGTAAVPAASAAAHRVGTLAPAVDLHDGPGRHVLGSDLPAREPSGLGSSAALRAVDEVCGRRRAGCSAR